MSDAVKSTTTQRVQYSLKKAEGFFATVDQDSNKVIDQNEIKDIAEKLGLDADALFRVLDADGSGNVNAAELKKVFKNFKKLLFDQLTEKNNGVLTKESLKGFAQKLDLDLDKVFERLDKNKDGRVDEAEFNRNIGGVLHHLDKFSKSAVEKEKEMGSPSYIVSLNGTYSKGSAVHYTGAMGVQSESMKDEYAREIDDAKKGVNEFVRGFDAFVDAVFADLDIGAKGYLTKDELKNFSGQLNLREEQVLDVMDVDKDGKITREEFGRQLSSIMNDFQRFYKEASGTDFQADDPGFVLEFAIQWESNETRNDKHRVRSDISTHNFTGRIDLFA